MKEKRQLHFFKNIFSLCEVSQSETEEKVEIRSLVVV